MFQCCLSVQLVGACYSLSVRGLRVVVVVSCLFGEKIIPIPSQVRILIQTSRYICNTSCQGDETYTTFLCAFFLIRISDSRLLQPTQSHRVSYRVSSSGTPPLEIKAKCNIVIIMIVCLLMIKIYINLHLFCLHKMSLSCVNHLSFMGFRVSNIERIADVPKRVFVPAIYFNKTVAFVHNFNLMS